MFHTFVNICTMFHIFDYVWEKTKFGKIDFQKWICFKELIFIFFLNQGSILNKSLKYGIFKNYLRKWMLLKGLILIISKTKGSILKKMNVNMVRYLCILISEGDFKTWLKKLRSDFRNFFSQRVDIHIFWSGLQISKWNMNTHVVWYLYIFSYLGSEKLIQIFKYCRNHESDLRKHTFWKG